MRSLEVSVQSVQTEQLRVFHAPSLCFHLSPTPPRLDYCSVTAAGQVGYLYLFCLLVLGLFYLVVRVAEFLQQ